MQNTNPLLHTALAYVGHGLSVIPVTRETKAPRLAHWQPYQERRATPAEVARWFTRGYADAAVAVVAGPVSGNLEVLDFDAPELFAPWLAQVQAVDPQLAAQLVIHRTQHGGYHVLYRSPVVAGNQKLAVDPERPGGKLTLIETRGAGGYVLAPPSAGYLALQGGLTALPELPAAARETLLRLARGFTREAQRPARPTQQPNRTSHSDKTRPGDDYNRRGDVACLLARHGWQVVAQHGAASTWRRPGKAQGVSATWNYGDSGFFYCFSTNAPPLEPERSYTAFGLLAALDYGGDFRAAARALQQAGYGERR